MGLDYALMDTEGYALPLRRLELEYLKPLRFDDRAVVRLQVLKTDRVRINIGYEIWKTHDRTLSGELILVSRAQTDHVLVKNLKPVSIPEEWRTKWQQPSVLKS